MFKRYFQEIQFGIRVPVTRFEVADFFPLQQYATFDFDQICSSEFADPPLAV